MEGEGFCRRQNVNKGERDEILQADGAVTTTGDGWLTRHRAVVAVGEAC